MNKPDFEKVLSQDVEGSPSWFTHVLSPLNRMFEYIKEAFDANISVSNLKAQIITLRNKGLGFPPVFPLSIVKKTRKGNIVGIFVCSIYTDDGQVWNSLNTVIWHQDGDNIFIDNVQGMGGQLLNVRLLALYE